MALFKVFRGQRDDLDSVTKVDGHAYFCTDDGSFWIDYLDGTEIKRKQVNENELTSLNDKFDDYVTLDTNQTISSNKTFSNDIYLMTDNNSPSLHLFSSLHYSYPNTFALSPWGFTLVGKDYSNGYVECTNTL